MASPNSDTHRFSSHETLVQLHLIHGFWYDYFLAEVWALLSLGASIGLVLIAVGFPLPATALVITRVQG